MPGIAELHVHDNQIGDDGARAIARARTIRRLHVGGNPITEAGLKAILELDLEVLTCWKTKIDAAMMDAIRTRFPNAC
jgi:hypothetical protein